MTDNVTPIPRRASRKKAEPKPLTFPQPNRSLAVVPPVPYIDDITTVIQAVVASSELRNELDKRDIRHAQALYKVVMDWPIAEIMVMGEAEFIALYRSKKEDIA